MHLPICIRLKEVTLHDGIQRIGDRAFHNCSLLERFTFISPRLTNIIQTGHWADIEIKINNIHGVAERRGGEVLISGTAMGRLSFIIMRIAALISFYEVKEATSMLELALWKSRIDQVDGHVTRNRQNALRMDMPGPVKDTILQYLCKDAKSLATSV